MTTAARTAPASIARTRTASKAVTQAAPEETHLGAWLVTAMVVAFFATVAIVFWMAHTVQV